MYLHWICKDSQFVENVHIYKKSTNVVRTSIVFQLYFNLFYLAMSSVRSKQRAKTLHSMWFQILGAESYSIPGLMMCNSIQRVGQNEIGFFFVENWIFFLSPENVTIFPLFLTNIKKFSAHPFYFWRKFHEAWVSLLLLLLLLFSHSINIYVCQAVSKCLSRRKQRKKST